MSSQRLFSVARKELIHIFRDPMTLFFTLFISIIQLFMLGYAIDTNVKHVRTVILDQAGTQESRQLLQKFENSEDLKIISRVFSNEEMNRAIVAGKARLGVKIPSDFSQRLQAGQTAQILILTPVRSWELVIGKMAPYLVLTLVEFCTIALFMNVFFSVPVHGSFATLLTLTLPFVLTMLGIGLLISTKASTRDAAMQMAMGTILPSVFLSGYVFPADSMPVFFSYLSQLVPATWLIDAARGVILRGAGQADLWPHAIVLWCMAVVSLTINSLRFRKQVA